MYILVDRFKYISKSVGQRTFGKKSKQKQNLIHKFNGTFEYYTPNLNMLKISRQFKKYNTNVSIIK